MTCQSNDDGKRVRAQCDNCRLWTDWVYSVGEMDDAYPDWITVIPIDPAAPVTHFCPDCKAAVEIH